VLKFVEDPGKKALTMYMIINTIALLCILVLPALLLVTLVAIVARPTGQRPRTQNGAGAVLHGGGFGGGGSASCGSAGSGGGGACAGGGQCC